MDIARLNGTCLVRVNAMDASNAQKRATRVKNDRIVELQDVSKID